MTTATTTITITEIAREHNRSAFDCGVSELNQYLRTFARQNHKGNLARTFVAVDEAHRVLGYYSLAASSISFEELPDEQARRLPKYPVPAVRLARLAVSTQAQGQGVGARLLVDALKRTLSASQIIGIKFIIVDAKNDTAKSFYRHFQFIELPHSPLVLILPIETVVALVR